MQAMSVFSQQIGGFADEYDRSLIQRLLRELAEVFDVPVSELEKEITAYPVEDSEVEQEEIVADGEEIQLKVGGEITSRFNTTEFLEWTKHNPEKAVEIIRAMQLWGRRPPAQGILLRRGALITLVSQFETLLSELIGAFFLRHPAALSAEKSLKLSELRIFESIQEAERYLIDKEVDGIIREGLAKSTDFFQRQKVDLKAIQQEQEMLTEVFQRRNTFVHNNGVVDRDYLTKVDSAYIRSKRIQLNNRLRISPQYLQETIETVWLVGAFLTQQCWRKWEKTEHELADKFVSDFMYDTLIDERFGLIIKAARIFSDLKISEPFNTTITINHAIALRELGQHEKMNKLLKRIKAATNLHKLAIYILYGQADKAFELLPSIVEEVEYDAERRRMRNWPLFKYLRNDSRFISAFEATGGTTV